MSQKNIIILGNSGVGKSSLLASLDGYINCHSSSDAIRTMKSTSKPIVFNKNVKIPITFTDGKGFGFFRNTTEESVNVKFLDTAGQSKYREDKLEFLEHELSSNNIDGIIVVHDLSDVYSIENTNSIYDFISKFDTDIPIVDVGNKSDILITSLRPKYKSHTDSKKKIFKNFDWVETSARMCSNVPQVFEALFRMIYKKPIVNIVKKLDRKRLRDEENKFVSAFDLYHNKFS